MARRAFSVLESMVPKLTGRTSMQYYSAALFLAVTVAEKTFDLSLHLHRCGPMAFHRLELCRFRVPRMSRLTVLKKYGPVLGLVLLTLAWIYLLASLVAWFLRSAI